MSEVIQYRTGESIVAGLRLIIDATHDLHREAVEIAGKDKVRGIPNSIIYMYEAQLCLLSALTEINRAALNESLEAFNAK